MAASEQDYHMSGHTEEKELLESPVQTQLLAIQIESIFLVSLEVMSGHSIWLSEQEETLSVKFYPNTTSSCQDKLGCLSLLSSYLKHTLKNQKAFVTEFF